MKLLRHTIALLACTAASVCSADVLPSLRVVFDNPIFNGSGSDNVQIQYTRPGASAVTYEHVAAGRFQGTGSQLNGVSDKIFVDGLDNLYMYCYDIYQDINHGSSVLYSVNFDGELERTRDFLGAVNQVLNIGKTTYDPYAWLHPTTGNQGAAIQLGIWESKYENFQTDPSWSLAAGAFRAVWLETETSNWYSAFIGSLSTSDALLAEDVITLESSTHQDMITADPPVRDVPEPGSLALLGAALAALALAQRRRARTSAKA